MTMLLRVGKWVAAAAVLVLLAVMSLVALTPHDHKVELVVTYPHSPPSAVWRVLTDHASEPQWLPVFGSVEREADNVGRPVWTHRSRDGVFVFTLMTISETPGQRYERLLLRDDQPTTQPWDGRWVYELEPVGEGTRLRITEYGWTGGFVFFIDLRFRRSPDEFLQYYARRIGVVLNDPAQVQVIRSH
jgi:hypothetical protein